MKTRIDMHGKGLMKLYDITDEEFIYLIDLADELKKKKKAGIKGNLLERKNIALVFEKMSTRTRCAAGVAAADEGGRAEYLSSREIHLGGKESVADTARVLGRMFDGILFRGYKHETVEKLQKYSGVPVWNGLTDESHPTQVLADLMTVREAFGRLKGLKLVYAGDGRNNVANSLMVGCAKAGVHFVNCTPPELSPQQDLIDGAEEIAARNKCTISIVHNIETAVAGANVIYTDVWVSMGEESKFAERLKLLRPYQVNMKVMQKTGNLEKNKIIFLHCLPAFHDKNTEITSDIGALEVTNDVFEAPFSKVFDEAENRVHTIKALFVAALGPAKNVVKSSIVRKAVKRK
ncbi:MAG: ornithine carbamoyltransferase [Kiritimatiellae bacterium]|nr:ornithine carbamoyltransferase [Kiritimatiellia bacterium]MDD5521436.1 ornithine carbamoyltransferase [Kiritimatiellia bacterium]